MNMAPFLFLITLFSSATCFVMNSWLLIWVMLEMNTLAFCSLMKTLTNKKKGLSENSMKYFIIQSVASVMLVFSVLSFKSSTLIFEILTLVSISSLMIKSGASPFHQWFVLMVKKILWKNSSLLMTWQKLAPVFLLIYYTKKLIIPFILLSSFVGALAQMNKKKTMEIMAFSSLFNLSWMMMGLLLNLWLFILFCLIYWMTVLTMMISINKMKMKDLTTENYSSVNKWLLMVIVINMGGIPPMSGFICKWIVFTEGLKMGMFLLMTLFLIISSINLYIYMRLINNQIMKATQKTNKTPTKPKKMFMKFNIFVNTVPLIMMTV